MGFGLQAAAVAGQVFVLPSLPSSPMDLAVTDVPVGESAEAVATFASGLLSELKQYLLTPSLQSGFVAAGVRSVPLAPQFLTAPAVRVAIVKLRPLSVTVTLVRSPKPLLATVPPT